MYVEQGCKIELSLDYLSSPQTRYLSLAMLKQLCGHESEGVHSFSFLGGGGGGFGVQTWS